MDLLIIIILGLCFGSFINALVWRVYEQSRTKSKNKLRELSISKGRSMCPHCKHTLAWYDLLPVVSWMSLGGKCRYCKAPIGWQYPFVELSTAIMFILSYKFFPYHLAFINYQVLFVLWLILLTGLIALFVYDVRWMLLPDKIVWPLFYIAVAQTMLLAISNKSFDPVIGGVLGVVAIAGSFYLLFGISGGKWIGGGDVKLGIVLGLLAGGIIEGFLVIFLASLLGTLVSLPLLALNKQGINKHIPFGPFLITATIIIYLFGAGIITWYKNQLLII